MRLYLEIQKTIFAGGVTLSGKGMSANATARRFRRKVSHEMQTPVADACSCAGQQVLVNSSIVDSIFACCSSQCHYFCLSIERAKQRNAEQLSLPIITQIFGKANSS